MSDLGLAADLRVGSVGNVLLDPSVFPFDAFEFDDPNRTPKPNLTMKNPWQFKIGDSELPWAEEKHGIIPSNGWFAQFISLSETTLESELSTSTVDPSYDNLSVSPYGVNGTVKFDFGDFPVSFANYTILYRHQSSWQYVTSGGIDNGPNIDVTGNIVTLWSNFPYVLPFTLSYSSQSFREVLFIPENYSQATIEEIINGADTFITYFTETGGNPSLTLSSQGLLWKSGDAFIRLGSTASFHGVDLDSGNFKTGVEGWQITKEGDVEFNDGTFRGTLEAADGEFTGTLNGVDGTFEGELRAVSGSMGYEGAGSIGVPVTGDERIYLEGAKLQFQSYDGSDWSTDRYIQASQGNLDIYSDSTNGGQGWSLISTYSYTGTSYTYVEFDLKYPTTGVIISSKTGEIQGTYNGNWFTMLDSTAAYKGVALNPGTYRLKDTDGTGYPTMTLVGAFGSSLGPQVYTGHLTWYN